MSETEVTKLIELHRQRLASVRSVDDVIGTILDAVQGNHSWAKNTYIFVTSDNGYSLGHHRQSGKRDPFRRASNTPLFVWGPGVARGKVTRHLLCSTDVAPTILDLAGKSTPDALDGKSFKQLLASPDSFGGDSVRSNLLVQNWDRKTTRRTFSFNSTFVALHRIDSEFRNQSFIERANGDREFYDIGKGYIPGESVIGDPFQLQNRIAQLSSIELSELEEELRQARSANNDDLPFVRIESPGQNTKLNSNVLRITGIADDNTAVSAVQLTIQPANGQNRYWDGKKWWSQVKTVEASLVNKEGRITDWSTELPIPKSYDHWPLVLTAAAVDEHGNLSPAHHLTVKW